MKLLSAIDVLTPIMALALLVGFASCVVSLVRALGGRRKIPFVSVSLLLVPIVFFFLSKFAIVNVLDEEIFNEGTRVTVAPSVVADPKQVLQDAVSGIYQWKGSSGSRPSDARYFFEVCSKGSCFVTTIAQDSGDPSVYWVSYETVIGANVPLGYTKLANGEI